MPEITDKQKVNMLYYSTAIKAKKVVNEFITGYTAVTGASFALVISSSDSISKLFGEDFALLSVLISCIAFILGLISLVFHSYSTLLDLRTFETEDIVKFRESIPEEARVKYGPEMLKKVDEDGWLIEHLIPLIFVGDIRALEPWQYPEKAFIVSRRATRTLFLGVFVWIFWIIIASYWVYSGNAKTTNRGTKQEFVKNETYCCRVQIGYLKRRDLVRKQNIIL